MKFEEEEKVNKHFEMDCVDRDIQIQIQIDDFRDFFEILEEDPSIDDAITYAVENVSKNNLFLKRKLTSPL